MVFIINEGSNRDNASMPLATRKRTYIRNVQRHEHSPEVLEATEEEWGRLEPRAELRSLSNTYNCVGMVFASRRTWVEPDQLELIFEDDGYRRVSSSDVTIGDVLVYRDSKKEITHVAIVVGVQKDLSLGGGFRFTVLSKWGGGGEYVHDQYHVPETLGQPSEFFSERFVSGTMEAEGWSLRDGT